LYEVIHDASWGLVEYERSEEFVWPLRLTMGLVKQDDRWPIRQMHWSYPGEGYPLLKLIEYEKR